MANSNIETSFQNLVNVIKEKTFSATDGATLQAAVADIQIDITDLGISKIGISQIGMANGVASLDANARIPDIELPIDLIHTSKIGMANGVASLDSTGKVPASQLPIVEKTVEFRYNITTKATGGTTATITVDKYVDNVLESSTDYKYSSLGSLVNIDDRFTLIYGSGNYVMTLLQDSEDHVAGYSTTWGYSDTVDFSETYDISMDDLSYIAAPFSEVVNYAVKDLVIHNGILYKCIAPHSAGVWNSSHFEETNIEKSFMMSSRDYVEAGRKANTTAGTRSTAEGNNVTSSGNNSHGEGYNTNATGNASHAEGSGTTASGACSHSEGQNTQATNTGSHAEGISSKATGSQSHAENNTTTASGHSSHAEGEVTTASHQGSHAEGNNTKTGNTYQHVQGKFNVGKATTAFEIGNGTSNNARANAVEVDWSGNATFAGDVIATVDNVTIPLSEAQLQNLSSAITIGGTSCTTVEGSIEALNDTKVSKTGDTIDGDLTIQHWIDVWGVRDVELPISSSPHNDVRFYSFVNREIQEDVGAYIGYYRNDLGEDYYSYSFYAFTSPSHPYPSRYIKIKIMNSSNNEEIDSFIIDSNDLPTYTESNPLIIEIPEGINDVYIMPEHQNTTIINATGISTTGSISASSLGTAASKNVPTSGDASSSQVVLGNDTRLTNSRNAADVYSWAKASTKPSYGISEITGITAQTTDPGAGSALTTGNIMFVYDA